jgi:hypothetical protein
MTKFILSIVIINYQIIIYKNIHLIDMQFKFILYNGIVEWRNDGEKSEIRCKRQKSEGSRIKSGIKIRSGREWLNLKNNITAFPAMKK